MFILAPSIQYNSELYTSQPSRKACVNKGIDVPTRNAPMSFTIGWHNNNNKMDMSVLKDINTVVLILVLSVNKPASALKCVFQPE